MNTKDELYTKNRIEDGMRYVSTMFGLEAKRNYIALYKCGNRIMLLHRINQYGSDIIAKAFFSSKNKYEEALNSIPLNEEEIEEHPVRALNKILNKFFGTSVITPKSRR